MRQPRAPRSKPPLVCVTGPSGSGKTTLVVSLVRELRALGVRVATLKHASHGFSMDRPGKDTWKMRQAGARNVAIVGGGEVALIADAAALDASGRDPDPISLARRLFSGVDLVLAEGFSPSKAPRVEVIGEVRKPVQPGTGPILAFVDRRAAPGGPCSAEAAASRTPDAPPIFSPSGTAELARFLLDVCGITLRAAAPGERADDSAASDSPGAAGPL